MNEPTEVPGVPEPIAELVGSCVRFVQVSIGVPLDLTHETLPILDHYVALTRAELERRPEAAPLLARATGAYFGQVLAAEFGGLWRVPSSDVHEWQLYFQPFFMLCNPVGIAYELVYEGKAHDGPPSELRFAPDEKALVEARLAALPAVSDEEYHTFSARFDAVQIAADALLAAQAAAGVGELTYEWGDYEDELALG